MDIIDTLYLGTPANQALDAPLTQEQKKSMIDAAAQGGQRLVQFISLGNRARKAIQDDPLGAVWLCQTPQKHRHHNLIGDQIPTIIIGLRFLAHYRIAANHRAQQFSTGDMRNP